MKGIIIKTTTKEKPITHNYGRLLVFYCKKCGEQLTACYENDIKNGGGIWYEWHYCSKCGNNLDFGEYYHKKERTIYDDLIDEKIEFKE